MIKTVMRLPENLAAWFAHIDFLGPLAIRLYLVPIFWMAGTEKLAHIDATIAWFGNVEWGLGLPFPKVMAYLATFSEIIGAIFLLCGFATRWMTIPLIITMIIAIITVHIDNGWLAIASQSSEAHVRLQDLLDWLAQAYPQRHHYITELGEPVVLNNGIEFATTYLIMLVSLFFTGGGRFFSMDYWVLLWCKRINKSCASGAKITQ